MHWFKVTRSDGRKRAELVQAHYFKVESGLLIFRRVNPQQGYPIFVKAFAPGSWRTVENDDANNPPPEGEYR